MNASITIPSPADNSQEMLAGESQSFDVRDVVDFHRRAGDGGIHHALSSMMQVLTNSIEATTGKQIKIDWLPSLDKESPSMGHFRFQIYGPRIDVATA